jgi:hypothetical protein
MPLLKLDVKFVFPMYDGEVNAEKLDNWVRQMEVYCNVQQIKDEATKIRLASLRLEGTTLIWWQSKMQHGTQQVGKIFHHGMILFPHLENSSILWDIRKRI